MEENLLIWVDDNDNVIDYGEKIKTHEFGQLHRAFSIFIIDRENGKLLLQKRSVKKYHSGGLWSNACCSHPYKGETWEEALQRCMRTELGITPSFTEQLSVFKYAGKFKYYSKYDNLSEHEIDYVFLYFLNGFMSKTIAYNKEEIDAVKWISLEELDGWLIANPNVFSAWFSDAYNLVKELLREIK